MLWVKRGTPFFTSCLIGFIGSRVVIWKVIFLKFDISLVWSFDGFVKCTLGYPTQTLIHFRSGANIAKYVRKCIHVDTYLLGSVSTTIAYLHFGVAPSRNLHNHVEHLLGLIDVEGNVVPRWDVAIWALWKICIGIFISKTLSMLHHHLSIIRTLPDHW